MLDPANAHRAEKEFITKHLNAGSFWAKDYPALGTELVLQTDARFLPFFDRTGYGFLSGWGAMQNCNLQKTPCEVDSIVRSRCLVRFTSTVSYAMLVVITMHHRT